MLCMFVLECLCGALWSWPVNEFYMVIEKQFIEGLDLKKDLSLRQV
jgi:hypothetical protein